MLTVSLVARSTGSAVMQAPVTQVIAIAAIESCGRREVIPAAQTRPVKNVIICSCPSVDTILVPVSKDRRPVAVFVIVGRHK